MMQAQKQLQKTLAQSSSIFDRCLSVVAWGSNTVGQVGQQGIGVVHKEPAIVNQLEGEKVISIAAGRQHSAAVVQSSQGGTVWSWGCGSSGKLGHGNSDNQGRPSRIEALVGQADIRQVVLGHQHTLLLDAEGAVYSCGDNGQGQCGLGTPLQKIADQQRAEWEVGHAEMISMSNESGSYSTTSASGPQASPWTTQQQQQRLAWARYMQPLTHTVQAERQAELDITNRLWAAAGNHASETVTDNSFPGLPHLTPTRIGRDLDRLVSDLPSTSGGLGDESVSHMTASRFFSALATASGRVLTFGGGYNGELGNERSWETEASSVEGPVLQALQQDKGAKQVAAGGTFCCALTNAGRVVLWGSLPGNPETRRRGAGARFMRIEGLPQIRHLAAGHAHVIMSDGQRIWAMGRWLTPSGSLCHGGRWGHPELVLELDEVRCLAAGSQSSAAVSGDGQLHLWGKLLSQDDVGVLQQKHGTRIGAQEMTETSPTWEGLGSEKPVAVSGLGDVQMVSLGFQHAVVVVK